MRPVLLKIEAFGPFAQEQTIDFRKLKDKNMFLIHGPTGGGKTTILDAICYVLYGVTSGDEREAKAMRSHFAKEDQLTQVKLIFKVATNKYYIHRIPGQKRPKKTGEGFTDQNPVAELYIYEGDNKKQIATGVNRVTEKIREIIGFDEDQFRQVIMIPQGKFRQLLVAKSQERQEILGEIFQTRKYKDVEEKIREEERILRQQIQEIKDKRLGQINNIKYHEGTELEELIKCENIDSDMVIKQVEIQCSEQEEEIENIAKEIESYDDKIIEMGKKITQATNNNEKYNKWIEAEKEYTKISNKAPIYDKKEEEYKFAQKAYPLKTKENYIYDLISQFKENKKEMTEIEKKLGKTQKDFSKVNNQLIEYEKKEEDIKRQEMNLNKAKTEYKPKLAELTKLERNKSIAKEEIKSIRGYLERLGEMKEKVQKEIQTGKNRLGERQSLNDKLIRQEIQLEQMRGRLAERKELKKYETNEKKLDSNFTQVKKQLEQATEEYRIASKSHNDIVQKWVKAQAGELAKKLETGEECPVCGSIHHPNPANWAKSTVSEEEVRENKAILDKAEEIYIKYKEEYIQVTTRYKENRGLIVSKKKNLGEYSSIALSQIEDKCGRLSIDISNIKRELKELETLEDKLSKREDKITNIEEEEDKLTRKELKYREELTKIETQINQIKEGIPTSLRVSSELDNYIRNLEEVINEYKEQYTSLKERREEIEASIIRLKSAKDERYKQADKIKERYESEKKEFVVELGKQGFSGYKEYELAYRSQEVLEELNREIREFKEQYTSLKANYMRLKEEVADIVPVNLEALYNDNRQLEKFRDKLSRNHQTLIIERNHNINQLSIIADTSRKIESKEKRYSIVGDLYKVARGENEKGLSFERFIQSSLFEDVLIRANERLTLMSNSRYELYRSDNRETRASHAGLELEVLDTYTGKKRHVRTLSGGEGFMASLSLALGLADVVQSYAGGISLETIFIDEGFGTLDAESLDASIGTLINLQKSGRLVGIISHVPELKDRIGARLEVVRTQSGSRAEFHI